MFCRVLLATPIRARDNSQHWLQEQLAQLVKLLRSAGFTQKQVAAQLAEISPEWERTLECIRQLEE